jgi:hypothetical protein
MGRWLLCDSSYNLRKQYNIYYKKTEIELPIISDNREIVNMQHRVGIVLFCFEYMLRICGSWK